MKDAFLKYIQLNTLNHFFISMVDFRLISTKILLVFVFPFMTHVDGNPKYYEDNLEKTHGRIIYSSVIFRHGDRSPILYGFEDGDPREYTIWPGPSQLTKIGKQQMYDLGKWFAARYADKIKNGYNHDLIIMNSTETDRAMMSGETFLAGMFPPTKDEMWADDGLRWQPIPVFEVYDRMIGAHDPCERYELETELLSMTPDLQKLNSTYSDVFEYVANHSLYGPMSATNVIKNIDLSWDCYSELFINEVYNLTLPTWSKKIYPEPLHYLSKLHFALYAYTPEMKRLRGGELVTQIVREMQQKRDGSRIQSFHMYAAHETIVAIFLDTLDMFNFIIPPAGASIIIELRMKDNDYIVTILYKNSTDHPPYLMQIPGCDELCSLEKFEELTAYLITEDWKSECQLGFLERLYYYNSSFALIVLIFLIFILVSLCVASARKLQKNRHHLRYTVLPD